MSKIGFKALAIGGGLAGALLAASSAQAACSGNVTVGNIVWISGCSSDNQANDGDDVPMYVDNTPNPVSSVFGSLNKNDDTFDNIKSASNVGATFENTASGFANFRSTLAGQSNNNLTAYTFTPGPTPTLPTGEAFPGFDGELFRGQIDNLTGGYTGNLNVTVNLSDGTTQTHQFTGLSKNNQDFGVLGFDENVEPGVLVTSVVISVAGEGGAWDEFKQINFSVPGVVASIPETSTWGMLVLGFMGLGYAAYRRPGRRSISALA